MRRVIAQRMVESKTQIPHFYISAELDMAALLQLRAQANETLQSSGEGKLSINDFILKACVETLRLVPQVNASFTENGIIRYGNIDIMFAVSLDEGLVTPVIRSAEGKTLRQISFEAKSLAERARDSKTETRRIPGWHFYCFQPGCLRYRELSGHHQSSPGSHSGSRKRYCETSGQCRGADCGGPAP